MKALQGVNLGGWLIPERWLTPSLFADTGTDDLFSLLKTSQGRRRYRQHLGEFITENDFRWLRGHGIELVRLPVGYWALEPTDGYLSNKKQIDWVMSMAEKYGIKVLLDLHAVRGSQNGEMHSGRKGEARWQLSRDYQDQTVTLLVRLAERYSTSSAFWGLELVNEPTVGRRYFTLLGFYRRAYRTLTRVLPAGVYTVFHDGFWPLLLSGALRARNDHPVVIDVHLYALPLRTPSIERYLARRRRLYGAMLWCLARQQPVIVGEWSAVLPQRFFATRPQSEHAGLLRQNITAQQTLYSSTLAHIYWNYKAEGEGMWNFRSLVERGDLVVH